MLKYKIDSLPDSLLSDLSKVNTSLNEHKIALSQLHPVYKIATVPPDISSYTISSWGQSAIQNHTHFPLLLIEITQVLFSTNV